MCVMLLLHSLALLQDKVENEAGEDERLMAAIECRLYCVWDWHVVHQVDMVIKVDAPV